MKKLLKNPLVQRALATLIAAYIRGVYQSTVWETENLGPIHAHATAGKPAIICFWHGRMVMMPNFWRYRMKLHLLGSRHADARLIYRTVQRFGVDTIIGSSDHGGAQALRAMVKAIRAGGSICMTPDGPRGPRMRANLGVAVLARMSGAPVVPVAYATTRGRVLRSWDRFFLPYPFGRGALVVGDPVTVARDADETAMEAARLLIEQRLNAVTREADRLCGRIPVEPAPADERPKVKVA